VWLQAGYGLDNWTYWHHSKYKLSQRHRWSPHFTIHHSSRYVFSSRFPATASNSGGSSASRAQVLLSQPPVQNSSQLHRSQLTTINSGTLNLILCCNCHLSRCHLFSVFFFFWQSSTLECHLNRLYQSFDCRFSTDWVIPWAEVKVTLRLMVTKLSEFLFHIP
jgi:hypothetical protein